MMRKDGGRAPERRKADMHSKASDTYIFKCTDCFQGLNTHQPQSEALQNTFTLLLQTFHFAASTEAQNKCSRWHIWSCVARWPISKLSILIADFKNVQIKEKLMYIFLRSLGGKKVIKRFMCGFQTCNKEPLCCWSSWQLIARHWAQSFSKPWNILSTVM